ncbi:MAG: Rne/Rng family ribonuclease [Pyrinomonadaceae bacterium]
MSKEMIISVNGREKKIAIVENGLTTEFYIERGEENSGVVGNIYKGRVQRVLPGMQSAFVDIGLERDAFLYVSDFFDEEEEIERIVLEKKQKEQKSDDEADREATDEIHKTRLKRDKKIDNFQEKAESATDVEPESEEEVAEEEPKQGRKKSSRRKKPSDRRRGGEKEEERDDSERPARGKKQEKENRDSDERIHFRENVLDPSEIEFGDSSFQRIVDEDDTGEMLKDAMMQEAITDKVRSIEFDMESIDTAEVGSLIETVEVSGFRRIADEDEAEAEVPATGKRKSSSRSRKSKAAKSEDSEGTEEKPKRGRKSTSSRGRKPKVSESEGEAGDAEDAGDSKPAPKKRGRRKKADAEQVEETNQDNQDLKTGEASVEQPEIISEMAVRRGSRGGRRKETTSPGKNPTQTTVHMDKGYTVSEADTPIVAEEEIADAEFRKPQKGRGGGGGRRRERPQAKITDLLTEGQEILVQIAKEPIAKKGARITSHIALPGRFLVYMPTIEHLGVSRKIESSKERGRLRTLLQSIVSNEEVPSGGFIVRTAGVGKSEEDIREDARYLAKTWLGIKKEADRAKSKTLIHQDLDIILRLLRDQLSDEFTAIRVDSEEEYMRIVEFVNRIQPKLVKRVKFHTLDEPILDTYGVSDEIDKALKHRVWLKSGGYLVLNQTEALIAIDVNTGKFVGKGNARLEDTITKTNLEAVKEIARQIRLRDLGGIIVLDLIDMEDRNNRKKVLQSLQEQLAKDKSPTKVLSFNDFGLIIMTRKRVKQSLERTLCSPCMNCDGAGWIKSAQTVCYEILEEARRISKGLIDVRHTTLRCHPEVSKALRGDEREVLELIESYLGIVDINSDKTIHQEQYDFAFV